MERFPHLRFVQKVTGKPRYSGGGQENPITAQNKANRTGHGGSLLQITSKLKSDWQNSFPARETEGLAEIDIYTTPVFLQINPDLITAQFDLESFGIEIISEEENGFIIGASSDGLRSLEEKINGFLHEEHGAGKIAEFWQIIDGDREVWKPQHVLSEHLFSKWSQFTDDETLFVEVSIAFTKPLKQEPDRTKKGGEKRYEKYTEELVRRDECLMERQEHFEKFINHYGNITSSLVELEDSFSCQVKISGKGLKDLVLNYQYVFEVSEIDEVQGIEGQKLDIPEIEVEIIQPDANSTVVGVIDSGIMEQHKYIATAIKGGSKSYVHGDSSTADYVKGGGHGTKVAGAILYPGGISILESPYKLPCFLRNIRVLNKDNALQHKFPAGLMEEIVEDHHDCRVFNLSINSNVPHRQKHISTWAAILDKLIFEQDVLFLISTGNITNKSIHNYLRNGNDYPDYLSEKYCKIANPAQSSFGLTVGSINIRSFEDDHWKSLGTDKEISPFSRTGPGIWNSIKPDVVEYGGGLVVSKNGASLVSQKEVLCPELIRSTLHGGSGLGRDTVGTSFATPKVTHIASVLKNIYPEEGVNLIRAFIAQGARLPNNYFYEPTKASIECFGYGLPSLKRVLNNTEYRISFYNTGEIVAEEAHIYWLKIPKSIREQSDEYEILIELTLSFTAPVRRTRQKTKSYLGTWLDWTSSRLDESYDTFAQRCLVFEDDQLTGNVQEEESDRVIPWKIRERGNWGEVRDFNRNNNSLQKDWAIVKSFELPEEMCFAVRGHKGWDRNKNEIPYAITVSFEILSAAIPLYEQFRIENEIEIET